MVLWSKEEIVGTSEKFKWGWGVGEYFIYTLYKLNVMVNK